MRSFLLKRARSTSPGDRRAYLALAAVCALAFALRLGLALALPNIHRPDEIFQNLEPAYRIWTGHGVITWEWRAGLRSPLFPGFLAGLIGLASLLGLGPAGYMAIIAAAMSLLSTAVVAMAFLIGRRRHGLSGGLICGVLCAIWPDLIYFGAKPLVEVVAGNLLALATCLVLLGEMPPGLKTASPGRKGLIAVGLLLGLALALRYQLAPAVLIVAVWACWRRPWHGLCWLVVGGITPIAALGAADWATWGSPFHSVWANFAVNALQHVSAQFGVKPGRWYLAQLVAIWGGAIVPIVVAMAFGIRRAPLLVAVAIAVILSHSLIAHKEISFIYAALPPMLILAGLGTCRLVAAAERTPAWTGRLTPARAALAFWVATGVTTTLNAGFLAMWKGHRAMLQADAALSHDVDLCGLGLRWPVRWEWSGSDTLIGKPVPIYSFASAAGVIRVAPAINAALGGPDVADNLPGFTLDRCWPSQDSEVCLARAAPGKRCIPDPGFDLNAVTNLGRLDTAVGADKQ